MTGTEDKLCVLFLDNKTFQDPARGYLFRFISCESFYAAVILIHKILKQAIIPHVCAFMDDLLLAWMEYCVPEKFLLSSLLVSPRLLPTSLGKSFLTA